VATSKGKERSLDAIDNQGGRSQALRADVNTIAAVALRKRCFVTKMEVCIKTTREDGISPVEDNDSRSFLKVKAKNRNEE